MISEVFYWLLNASILGGAAGLIVLALRSIKRLPRFAAYLLWALALVRLWIPVGLGSRYSPLTLLSGFTKSVAVWSQGATMMNAMRAADSYFPIEYKTRRLAELFHIACAVWLTVACAAVLSCALLYAFTKSELKSAVRLRDNIYESDKIKSPAVYGVFRPRIVLPGAIAADELEYILLHERVHIRRRDNLLRMIAIVTACVHWFNPLVWVFLRAFLADMELACDAGVLKELDRSERKAYASAILRFSAGKAYFSSAFGGAKTRVRVENILSYKKLTALSAIGVGLLILAGAAVLLTNAPGS